METYFVKELKWLKNYIRFWKETKKIKGEKSFLIGTPVYGNLGDQAITLGEYKFLEDIQYNKTVIEIPSFIFEDIPDYLSCLLANLIF